MTILHPHHSGACTGTCTSAGAGAGARTRTICHPFQVLVTGNGVLPFSFGQLFLVLPCWDQPLWPLSDLDLDLDTGVASCS